MWLAPVVAIVTLRVCYFWIRHGQAIQQKKKKKHKKSEPRSSQKTENSTPTSPKNLYKLTYEHRASAIRVWFLSPIWSTERGTKRGWCDISEGMKYSVRRGATTRLKRWVQRIWGEWQRESRKEVEGKRVERRRRRRPTPVSRPMLPVPPTPIFGWSATWASLDRPISLPP